MENPKSSETNYKWIVEGKKYIYQGKYPFSFFPSKKDGENWFNLRTRHKEINYKLETNGSGASVFKLEYFPLSEDRSALVVYFFEGFTQYFKYTGSVRVYLIPLYLDDIGRVFKGPIVWYEERGKNSRIREYQVYARDLTNDKIKDIIVTMGGIKRVYYIRDARFVSL